MQWMFLTRHSDSYGRDVGQIQAGGSGVAVFSDRASWRAGKRLKKP